MPKTSSTDTTRFPITGSKVGRVGRIRNATYRLSETVFELRPKKLQFAVLGIVFGIIGFGLPVFRIVNWGFEDPVGLLIFAGLSVVFLLVSVLLLIGPGTESFFFKFDLQSGRVHYHDGSQQAEMPLELASKVLMTEEIESVAQIEDSSSKQKHSYPIVVFFRDQPMVISNCGDRSWCEKCARDLANFLKVEFEKDFDKGNLITH